MDLEKRKKFIILDGQGILYRTFYALPSLTTSFGQIINAVYGFTVILNKLLEEENPDYITIAFDTAAPTFRHKEFKEYKIHRPKMPEELCSQIPLVQEVIQGYNIRICSREGYEADDIIGTLVKEAERRNFQTLIVTGDKDALQLISPLTRVMNTIKGVSEVEVYDQDSILNKYGLEPERIVEIIALKGDPSDNIPGVPGIGEKIALNLISKFGNLDNLFKNIEQVTPVSLRDKLKEYQEQIFLSKKLATIITDVPLDYNFDDFRISLPNYELLLKIFKKLEFKNLVQKISEKFNSREGGVKYNLIETEEQLKELLLLLEREKYFSFQLLTSSPPVITGKILGISLSFKNNKNFYLPVTADNLVEGAKYHFLKEGIKKLAPFFEDKEIFKIGYNLKDIFILLNHYQIELEGDIFDILIAAYLLDPSQKDYALPNLLWEYLGYFQNKKVKDSKNIHQSVEDICQTTHQMLELKEVLEKQLKEKELLALFKDIELPLSRVLARMEIRGFKLDIDFLRDLSEQINLYLKGLEEKIYHLAGCKFNLNSPKQLSKILFEELKLPVIKKSKTGPSTDSFVLNTLAPQHKIIAFLLEYRELEKLKNTYIDKLPLLVNNQTKRIHTSFHQTITSTGRLSSSDPNLQNIPIRTEMGKKIRRAFVAEENFILLSADYSQIELRILAHLSGDRILKEAFIRNEDIHARTASDIFELEPDLINEKMRRMAKTINFGIIYGMSSYGLAQSLGISREEAENYIYHYFQKFPGVKKYIEDQKEVARKNGYVLTLLNRRRYLTGINSPDKNIREFNERIAINTPIQGSAADLIKLAMIKIDQEIQKRRLKSRLILQIHDELILEVEQKDIEELKKLVKDIMENALDLSIPLVVNLKTGSNWAELN